MRTNVYEILDEFKTATTKQGRLDVLQKNGSSLLKDWLQGCFHPAIKFTINEMPPYKSEEVPAGLSYSNMGEAMARVYLFLEESQRVPPNLTNKRKEELLIQLLEGMEPKEAELFAGMIMKNVKVPYLTAPLIREAFPGLLPE